MEQGTRVVSVCGSVNWVENLVKGWGQMSEHYGMNFGGAGTTSQGLNSNGFNMLWRTGRSQPYI